MTKNQKSVSLPSILKLISVGKPKYKVVLKNPEQSDVYVGNFKVQIICKFRMKQEAF